MSREEAREALSLSEPFQKSSPKEQEEAINEFLEKWIKKFGS